LHLGDVLSEAALHRVLEPANRFTEGPGELRKLLGAKDQQGYYEDQDNLGGSEPAHSRTPRKRQHPFLSLVYRKIARLNIRRSGHSLRAFGVDQLVFL